ncbi:coiled-coil domain-containing protein 63-like isoform X1 [Xiphophorus maculatus]|uniref:Outer dynein arm docking complex subunit 1 n=1 Tax=Xiphophorus maculatus TaxID=8083 RepID=M4AS30_XIPMA|nr:coiled-coil domain-containing protein 63-like isoform X1 [Xiphophorus maculatus]XP_023180373.1 coiled-coil domain-containing protein 63-like isoform X1 [Xiphophorus maculatus]
MAQGRSVMSGRSDNLEMDADEVAKLEIAELQNQYRIMKQRDQRGYEIQAREQIRKQEKEIGNLLKEREEVIRNLNARKNVARQQQDQEEVRSLVEQNKALDKEMEKERECQKKLQTEILNMEMRLAEIRKGGGGSSLSQSAKARKVKKIIRDMESNVKRASTQFSGLMTKNSQLKEELGTLCIEREHFQKLRNNLAKEVHKLRKNIEEMTRLSTSAYDIRQEALARMKLLREKATKDLIQCNTEMRELERLIANEFTLKNFIMTKCNEELGYYDDKMAPGQLPGAKALSKMLSGEQTVENLKDTFEKLQAIMGEKNLDQLVNSFIEAKDRNLAFLKFVNEQNSETVKLKDQINKQIKEEMEKFNRQELEQEQKHLSLLKDMKGKINEAESQTETYASQADTISTILDQIKKGVDNIFKEVGCDYAAVEERLGFTSGITESNIITYLDLIEEKTNELLSVQAFLKFKELKDDFDAADLARNFLGQNPDLKRELSVHTSLSSLDSGPEEPPITDEDDRPLSHEELCRKIMRRKAEWSSRSHLSYKSL